MSWHRLLLTPWIVLGLVWFGSAAFTRATVRRESVASRASFVVPLVLGACLLFFHAFSNFLPWLELRLFPASDAALELGLALSAIGVAFAIWARATLGKLWSGGITLKEGHRLVQSGPYALARHPIYTGIAFGFVGTAISVGTLGAALGLVVAVAALIHKLGIEDRLMAGHFGDEHSKYRARVKRLVPFIW